MPVNQEDIARALGIGRATVSRAINGHPSVSENMRCKIFTKCQEMGYTPNYAARSLSSSKSRTISVVRWGIHLPEVHTRWVEHLHTSAADRGYKLRLDRAQEVETVTSEASVDGFILFGSEYNIPISVMQAVKTSQVPYIFTDCSVDNTDTNCVISDNVGGAQKAVEFLLTLGHRQIGFLGYVPQGVCQDRLNGYQLGLLSAGQKIDYSMVIEQNTWPMEVSDVTHNEIQIVAMLKKGVTGFLASNDINGIGLIKTLKRLGIEVPRDVSVICFDETSLTKAWEPPLTTVVQDLPRLAESAVEMLLSFCSSGKAHTNVTIPSYLVVRGSTYSCQNA